jgi:hypothetical protein
MAEHDNGLIYYLLDATRLAQRVKIGTTTSLKSRLAALRYQTVARQDPLVLALEPGGYTVEKQRHQQFDDLRLGGEWFSYEGALREWVAELPNPVGLLYDNPDLWQYARGFGMVPDVSVTATPRSDVEVPTEMYEVEF